MGDVKCLVARDVLADAMADERAEILLATRWVDFVTVFA